ncbi:MAG TPA: DUF433 domain-containing protein [Steroidobacteraceae bacterium]|nr:DUF433 domain-containing protein [Steroidobacteraceae bacterium]
MSIPRRKALLKTPNYPFAEAAHYLHLSVTTLHAWCRGGRRFQPIIRLDGKPSDGLSFRNLIEAHVLSAIQGKNGGASVRISEALRNVGRHLDMEECLASARFATRGIGVFVEALYGKSRASGRRRADVTEAIRVHLQRIDRDARGIPMRFYPFTCERSDKQLIKSLVIDPRIAFGRPVLVGTALPTSVVADRFRAGDTVTELAKDYVAHPAVIEEAIRYELYRRQAA